MRAPFISTVAVFLWFAALPGFASAADADMSNAVAACDGKFGLCGYVDKQTRQEIIPARFERAMPFSEGVAAVRIDGRFGFIDDRGQIVIEPRFDLAGDFHQGLTEILVGNKTGVINRAGEIVVPPVFGRAVPLTRDVIVATEGTWTSGYYEGFERLPGLDEGIFENRGPFGLYHISGYWIHRPDLRHVSAFGRDGGGLIWATERKNNLDRVGLLASDGHWIIEPQYQYAGRLNEERAVVRKLVDGVMMEGAVDQTGQLVVPLRSWFLFGWRNGWSMVRESGQSGRRGLLDKNGNLIGGRYFDKVEPWDVGDVSGVLLDDRWMGVDRAGNIVPHPGNGRVFASCPAGARAIEIDGKTQLTDASGQPTAPYLLERLLERPACDRPFRVQLKDKWGFVNPDGRLLFDPPPFDNLYNFEEDYALVMQGSKWGIIDTSGRFVLAPKLDAFIERRAGLFHVTMDGREIWITASGEERPEPPVKYEIPPGMLECGHGVRLIERDGKWGIADSDGRDLIPPRYRALVCFKNGIAWVPIDDRRQWCALGPDGALHENPACQAQHYPYIQTHSAPEELAKDPFENSVLWSRAYLEFGAGRRDAPPRWLPDGPRGGVFFSVIR